MPELSHLAWTPLYYKIKACIETRHLALIVSKHHVKFIYILSKKRNAYSISHGFIFKVNKKTYVKSIKIKNIYQQSLSHKFWNWTHVWESEVLRYVRVVPENDNSMIRSNVNIECVHRWHQARSAHGVS